MEARKNVWCLQLLQYLVFSKGYLRVSVAYQGPNKPEDFWLINASEKYQIIHLTDEKESQRIHNSDYTVQTYNRICELLYEVKNCRMLDISLNEDSVDRQSHGIRYIHLHPGCALEDDIREIFPEMATVIHDVQDPQQELVKLEREIVLQAMKKRRSTNSFPFAARGSLCRSFIIPAVICVILWAAVNLMAAAHQTATVNTAIALGAYYKAFVTILHQYWRLLTSGFIHVSVLHLLCNMISLFSLAGSVEKQFGFRKSMMILLMSIVVGNLLEFVAGPNKVCVGISGGLYGYLGAMTVHYIRSGYFKNRVFRRNYLNTLYINLLISLMPNVSYISHLAGFVTGGFLAVLCDEQLARSLKINVAVCSLLLAGSIGYLATKYDSLDTFYYQTDVEVARVYENIGWKSLADKIVRET
jgi:membrane associated rhomboid family serine protease